MHYELCIMNYTPEVVGMLATEFDMDIALKVAREDGIQTGREEGREEGIEKFQNYVLDLMEQGLSQEEIKNKIKEAKKVIHNS